MTDIKNSNQKEDLDDSSGWTLHSQNPTDHNIDIFSNLEPEDSEVYLEEWQNKIAMEAHHDGHIKLYHLVFILAKEEIYSDILPKLWEFFHLNRDIKLLNGTTISDKENRIPKWSPSWIETAHGRANPWYWLLLRWTINPYFDAEGLGFIKSQYFGYIENEQQKQGIKLYRFVNRQPKELNDDEEQSPTQYINLEEFKRYIKENKALKKMAIPLPRRLYIEEAYEDSTVKRQPISTNEKKLRPNQRHKIECKKVAKELWKKNPTMTIADMITCQEIIDVSKRRNGDMYMENTVRNWIKDLCPNRLPGRRPKK